eukprot:g142.t1
MLKHASRRCSVVCASKKDDGVPSPVDLVKLGGQLTSRRQFARGISLATFFALGGNFLGITSFLLSLDGGRIADFTKLDVLIPISRFRRCWNPELGFEFQYNGEWLADQRLLMRTAERIEQQNPLDLPSLAPRSTRDYDSDPVAAFGPAGSRGEENISVVVSSAVPGFQLTMLGNAQIAAEKLLETKIAPEGSGKNAVLLNVDEKYT